MKTPDFRTMKTITAILNLTLATIFLSCNRQTNDNEQSINPVLGDISFIETFGQKPGATTDEDLRVRTHLAYVENLLRQKDVSGWTAGQREKRKHLLDLLHQYWMTGIFPRNYDYNGVRQPCFIDKDGIICAVGYLVEQTTGRQAAEHISDIHKYDKVLAMNDDAVDTWIKTSGLTKEECAMIQPTYGPPPTYNYNYISPAYGISSSVLGGVNLAFCTMNAIGISTKAKNKVVPVISLFTGAGSVILGAINFPESSGSWYLYTNESQKHLSLANIGFGTTTMILGVLNLCANKKAKSKSVAWNIYSFPVADTQVGLGFCLTKKI
jgi:hypothetical protein